MTDEPEIEEEIAEEEIAEEQDPGGDDAAEEARKYGWRPKEEYDRDPEGWVDAERFLEFPSTISKQLRDQKRDLQKQLDGSEASRKRDIDRLSASTKQAIDIARKQEQERYQTELAAIQAQKRQAVDTADTEAYDSLSKRESELRPPVNQKETNH